jgi:hypothetical protein
MATRSLGMTTQDSQQDGVRIMQSESTLHSENWFRRKSNFVQVPDAHTATRLGSGIVAHLGHTGCGSEQVSLRCASIMVCAALTASTSSRVGAPQAPQHPRPAMVQVPGPLQAAHAIGCPSVPASPDGSSNDRAPHEDIQTTTGQRARIYDDHGRRVLRVTLIETRPCNCLADRCPVGSEIRSVRAFDRHAVIAWSNADAALGERRGHARRRPERGADQGRERGWNEVC